MIFATLINQIAAEKRAAKANHIQASSDPNASLVRVSEGPYTGMHGTLRSWCRTDGTLAVKLEDGKTVWLQASAIAPVAKADAPLPIFEGLDEESKAVALEAGYHPAVTTPADEASLVAFETASAEDPYSKNLAAQMRTNFMAIKAASADSVDFSHYVLYAAVSMHMHGPNQNEVVIGDTSIFFSYNTPVVVVKGDKIFQTEKKWSVTTSRHINKFLAGRQATKVPQEQIDKLASKVDKKNMKKSVPAEVEEEPKADVEAAIVSDEDLHKALRGYCRAKGIRYPGKEDSPELDALVHEFGKHQANSVEAESKKQSIRNRIEAAHGKALLEIHAADPDKVKEILERAKARQGGAKPDTALKPPSDLKKLAEEAKAKLAPKKKEILPYKGVQKSNKEGEAPEGANAHKIKQEHPEKVKEGSTSVALPESKNRPAEIPEENLGQIKDAPENLVKLANEVVKFSETKAAIEAAILESADDIKKAEGYEEVSAGIVDTMKEIDKALQGVPEEAVNIGRAILALIRKPLTPTKFNFNEAENKAIEAATKAVKEANAALDKAKAEAEKAAKERGDVEYKESREVKLFPHPKKREGENAVGKTGPGAFQMVKEAANVKSSLAVQAGLLDVFKGLASKLTSIFKGTIAPLEKVKEMLEKKGKESKKEAVKARLEAALKKGRIEAAPKVDKVYDALIDAGCKVEGHESDLFVEETPESMDVLNKLGIVPDKFKESKSGKPWLEIPFAFKPFWDAKNGKGVPETAEGLLSRPMNPSVKDIKAGATGSMWEKNFREKKNEAKP